jgi:hypothetical protein
MPRVTFFELPVDDPERAAAFYRAAFGWEIHQWDGPVEYWLVKTGPAGEPGINGGLRRRARPGEAPNACIDVSDIDAAMAAIVAAGGTLLSGKLAIPSIGFYCSFLDPEGNPMAVVEEHGARNP